MPPGKTAFDVAMGLARNDPQAFNMLRNKKIDDAIALGVTEASLRKLQAQIDEQRASALNPRDNLTAIMVMLGGKLTSLGESLAQWQSLLDGELLEDHPDALVPLEKIGGMLAATTSLQKCIADAVGEMPGAGECS